MAFGPQGDQGQDALLQTQAPVEIAAPSRVETKAVRHNQLGGIPLDADVCGAQDGRALSLFDLPPQQTAPLFERPLPSGRLGHDVARQHLWEEDVAVVGGDDDVTVAQADQLGDRSLEVAEQVGHVLACLAQGDGLAHTINPRIAHYHQISVLEAGLTFSCGRQREELADFDVHKTITILFGQKLHTVGRGFETTVAQVGDQVAVHLAHGQRAIRPGQKGGHTHQRDGGERGRHRL